MLAVQLLHAVLAQAPDAAQHSSPWWQILLNGTSLATFIGLVWFVATYKGKVDRVIKVVTPEDEEKALGVRVKKLEDVVDGDGRGNPGCAARHELIDKRLSEAPSQKSMSAAFTKIEELTRLLTDAVQELKLQAADDRRQFEVTVEHLRGVTKRLDDRISRLLGEEVAADEDLPQRGPMKRQATNPRLEVGSILGKKGG